MPIAIAGLRRYARPLIGIGLTIVAIYAALLMVVFLNFFLVDRSTRGLVIPSGGSLGASLLMATFPEIKNTLSKVYSLANVDAKMKMMAGFTATAVVAAALCGCERPKVNEKMRLSNAGNTVDAVLAEPSTGATVATPTYLYLLPKGMHASGAPVFIADHAMKVTISWIDDATVVLKADRARVFTRSEHEMVSLGYFEKHAVNVQYLISEELP